MRAQPGGLSPNNKEGLELNINLLQEEQEAQMGAYGRETLDDAASMLQRSGLIRFQDYDRIMSELRRNFA